MLHTHFICKCRLRRIWSLLDTYNTGWSFSNVVSIVCMLGPIEFTLVPLQWWWICGDLNLCIQGYICYDKCSSTCMCIIKCFYNIINCFHHTLIEVLYDLSTFWLVLVCQINVDMIEKTRSTYIVVFFNMLFRAFPDDWYVFQPLAIVTLTMKIANFVHKMMVKTHQVNV